MNNTTYRLQHIAGIMTVIVIAVAAGMIVAWRAPGLNSLAQDELMRARGPLAPTDDIVIVAIDEASIARFGRFPWARSLMAKAMDRISDARPRVITLDVLYSDASNQKDDEALSASIARAGNVVVAAQLIKAETVVDARRAVWLKPLPAIERAAAGVGHNGVTTDFDGVARAVLLRQVDDEAEALWALAVETVRVGDGAARIDVRDTPTGVLVSKRLIPVEADPRAVIAAGQTVESQPETIRADRMTLDYLGPTGSFVAQTYGIADVLDGRIAPESLRGKYVLVGATAASMGDRLASPFTRQESAEGDQHAQPMPGVEALANSLNTILRGRFYSAPPDWVAVLCAGLIAALVLGALSLTQGRGGLPVAFAALTGLPGVILLASYLAFTRWLIAPPLVPMLAAFTTALPLALLRRTMMASADLDERIAELTQAGTPITSLLRTESEASQSPAPVALIARVANASAVAIFARYPSDKAGDDFQMIAGHGDALVQVGDPAVGVEANRFVSLSQMSGGSVVEALIRDDTARVSFPFAETKPQETHPRLLTRRLGEGEKPEGALVLVCPLAELPTQETLRACEEIAALQIARMHEMNEAGANRNLLARWLRLPSGLPGKSRKLARLQRRLLERSLFVDRALHSGTDGLLIASVDGQITFANPSAAAIFGFSQQALLRHNLFELAGDSFGADNELRTTLVRLLVERAPVEREAAIGGAPVKHYLLRLASIGDNDDGAVPVNGIIATLSDITRQRELQQMKNDVMALVTHELRTPLTAIQGMSEVLEQYQLSPEEQHEMFRAINDEAKRLARMIEEYLDISRIESGARRLRAAPVRVEKLLEEALLTLRPVAAQRRLTIIRRVAPDLPVIMADSDLLTRAVTNLISNAIKYSPAGKEITINARAEGQALRIEVVDQGYGIPAADLERIFEKFYRVSRAEDTDVQGTGLGLAFVREIVELHGGRVTVSSVAGSGSTFSLLLPPLNSGAATE
jgi:PAS domain S-box-containing protein